MSGINFRKFFCKSAKGWFYKLCDYQRYEETKPLPVPPEPPIDYITVEICYESGLLPNPYCKTKIHESFIVGTEPTETCQLCKKPTKMVNVEICIESGQRAWKWCKKRGCTATIAFKEGEQPTTWCGLHKKPQKALKEAHYGGIGMLLWFMHGSWKDKNLVEWTGYLNRTVERIRREGFSVVDFFVWICDGTAGNWYANKKIPFEIINGEVNFSSANPKWWKRFNIFIETLHRWGLEPSICPLPTLYTEWAFKNATTPMDFWGVIARAEQIAFVRRLIKGVQYRYGQDYVPWIKANNELSNHGNDPLGAMYAKWYVDLFDGIQDLFPEKDDVSKWVLNTDKCEWIVIPFAYDETFEFRGYKLGQDRFLRNGRRMYVDEIHKISCPENVLDGRVDKALLANFPRTTPQRDHEDCGCGFDEDNELIGKGAGIGPYHVGDNKQTFQAQKLLHSKYKAKNRRAISVYLPLDCLQIKAGTKNVPMEFMKEEELDWTRVKAFIRGIRAGLK